MSVNTFFKIDHKMKNLKTIVLYSSIIFLLGCSSSPQIAEMGTDTTAVKEASTNKEGNLDGSASIQNEENEGVPAELLGNYHGVQPSYFMKNQYGDEMIINGNKVSVPSCDYKFLLKENNVANLQQINLEDNSRVYYEGTYKIISSINNTLKIECSLSDGEGSNPTFILTINKGTKSGNCNEGNSPVFTIEK
jgi:hypothetical protein